MAKPIDRAEVHGEEVGAYLAAGDVDQANALSTQYIEELWRKNKNEKAYERQLQEFFEGMQKSDPDDVHLTKDAAGKLTGIFCDYAAADLAERADKSLKNGTPLNLVSLALNNELQRERPEARRNLIKEDVVKDFNRRAEHKQGTTRYRASINKAGEIEVNRIYFT